MSRFFNLVLAVLLMFLLILPSFARGFGGGSSRSSSFPVKSYTPKTVSYTPKTVKVVTHTRYVSNPTVVHHYSSEDNTLNTIATFALLNSLSHSGNSVDSNR